MTATTTTSHTHQAFTSGGSTYDTLAAVATRLAVLAVEDTLNDPSDERTIERITLVEHLLRFANMHGSPRPAATVRRALAGMQDALGRPGTPVLPVLEELGIAMCPEVRVQRLEPR
ncbi:hypothetical protein [Citricoccus sp.]|uniref:hypothetical protein n=1 Tax=Citricoccus sp. TaxID=1978372 RepID=UPI0028BEB48F|nr:hypothetical protein [Citricoccus sp.]